MTRTLYRMVLTDELNPVDRAKRVEIRTYCEATDHDAIRLLYGHAFGEATWPADWDRFDEFEPSGAFVAEEKAGGEDGPTVSRLVGFALGFPRDDHGYISVVAVLPDMRRSGVGSALVTATVDHLRASGLRAVRIDAFTDATPAVSLYLKLGFRIESTFEDDDA